MVIWGEGFRVLVGLYSVEGLGVLDLGFKFRGLGFRGLKI